jgi:hypothetical protein
VTLNGNAWFENFGNGGAAVGAYTLTITSVTSPISTAAGTEYTVHGSLSATLPPRSENTNNATITLSATF